MALSIKNPEADHLARELSAVTGETLTDAVMAALRERLDRERHRRRPGIASRLHRLAAETSRLPVLDRRHPDEIIGYDEDGIPS
ncbi:MAG: type II toxin-antitoxin system VapB family antitoxin [Actinobacteria bacterium]|nr:type II toxin-antitoxin system VapB family antitoxin [Actinomycetota bacterium]